MQYYSLSTLSMKPASSGVTETYIPLWMADGTSFGTFSTSNVYLRDGNGGIASSAGSDVKLFTLSSNWSSGTKFAFEACIYTNGATNNMQLYDFNTSSVVPGSLVSTVSTAAIVVRSSQFTLTPGHQYGIAWYTDNASNAASIIGASLIVFG